MPAFEPSHTEVYVSDASSAGDQICKSGTARMPRVLLIEDDAETACEISAELAERGYAVEWAANGVDGLAKARAGKTDILIVDRMLPGLDGLSVIEMLRKERVRTPVLVLSALGAVDDRVRGLRSGGDDYLTKPFALVELLARVEALLRRPARDPGHRFCEWDRSSLTCSHEPPSEPNEPLISCRASSACLNT